MRLLFPAALAPAVAGALSVLGLAFFFISALLLQFLRGDYDWVTTPLSFYLLGPYSTWLVVAYFALAASIALVALALWQELVPAARQRAPLLLFLGAALCVCIVALAHTDTPYGPHPTAHGLLHNLAAALAFLGITVGMLLQSWRFRLDPVWQRYHWRALILAAVTFVAFWLYALWRALPRGASEKAVILLVLLWLLFVSRWLMLTRLKTET